LVNFARISLLMEDQLPDLPSLTGEGSAHDLPKGSTAQVAEWKNSFLERVRRFSLSLWGTYLARIGIREVHLPPITIVISAVGSSKNLGETIGSLLSARYRRLHIAVVALADDTEVAKNIPEHPDVKLRVAQSGTNRSGAIRSVLLRSENPVFAWLEPGDILSGDVLNRVGRAFRRSEQVGGVIVRQEDAPFKRSPDSEIWDFNTLRVKTCSFPAKLFVRRELYWAATKTFAGTDYDCDDWAVALNSSRFSHVQALSGGSYQPAHPEAEGSAEKSRKAESMIDASMWWSERLRWSIRQRLKWQAPHALRPHSSHTKSAGANIANPWIGRSAAFVDLFTPLSGIDHLAGLSPGETIAFLGSYRWSFRNQPALARSIFWDQGTDILILQRTVESNQLQEGAEVEISIEAGKEQEAQTLAAGTAVLLRDLPGELRSHFARDILISTWPLPGRTQETDPTIFGSPFDLLVLSRHLNVFARPLVTLRKAANNLRWGGSLIVGCATFEKGTVDIDWRQSAQFMQSEYALLYSKDALFDAITVAGFEVTRFILLAAQDLSALAKPDRTRQQLRTIGTALGGDPNRAQFGSGYYMLLLCRRNF
jgi:hypothetical protein